MTPSTPTLGTINQLDPIRVVFSVSYRVMVAAQQKTGATQGQLTSRVAVDLKLPDGSEYKPAGKIAFLNNQVNPQTGTVSFYADFPNPDRLLLPGAFVNVEIHRAKPQERPLVPAEALQTDQSGSFVLVAGAGNKSSSGRSPSGRRSPRNLSSTRASRAVSASLSPACRR